jgi:hypothetical protein
MRSGWSASLPDVLLRFGDCLVLGFAALGSAAGFTAFASPSGPNVPKRTAPGASPNRRGLVRLGIIAWSLLKTGENKATS